MCCRNAQSPRNAFRGEGYFPRCPECGGFHRDVTTAFQGLVLEACAALIPSMDKLTRDFQCDHPETAWDYDRDTGLIMMDVPGRGRALANFHLIGSWDEGSGAFDWAWAQEDPSHPELIKIAEHCRRVGAHYWLRTLTSPQVYVGETEAWHLGMVTAYLSDLPMVHAVETEKGVSFVALDRPMLVN